MSWSFVFAFKKEKKKKQLKGFTGNEVGGSDFMINIGLCKTFDLNSKKKKEARNQNVACFKYT